MSLITCPSGLAGEIRKMKGKEGKLLADRRSARGTFLADQILAGCWTITKDRGIYSDFAPGQVPDWSQVLAGDRTYALIQIRLLTFPKPYAIRVSCRECRKPIPWDVPLDQLAIKPMAEADKASYANDNQFGTALADGTPVVFKIPTGYDQNRWAGQLQDDNDRLLLSVLMRLKKFGDKHPNDFRQALEDLDFDEITRLYDTFAEHDFGVETGIAIECQSCGEQQEVELPFDRNFFFPTKLR